jgi:fumarate hydratase class II
MTSTRQEEDALGAVEVPAEHLWGAQTQRSVENFPIGAGRFRFPRPVIRAFGVVKKAAALANRELGQLPADKADLIARAADEVIAGRWDDEFPLVVFQTGSGTQSNMNANEVIANRAIQLAGGVLGSKKPIHPNDDVNRGQSSNDVFPTVMHVATVHALVHDLFPAVTALRDTLEAKARAYAGLVMIGRTHLQDATPLTVGQMISGWVAQLDEAMAAVGATLPGLHKLALGGTAVGTGLNAHPRFAEVAIAHIAREGSQPFVGAPNKFAALAAHDALVTTSGTLRTLAAALMKIANDVRWYASGPRAGIAELRIPENEPGSSIMPGKVNPVICEATMMVAAQVIGNDATVAFAGSQGNLELNVMMPVMARNLLESARLLSTSSTVLAQRCVDGITADVGRMRAYAESSPSVVTPLNKHVGYEEAARIAKQAMKDGTTIRETVLAMGYVDRGDLTEQQLDEALDVESMTHP